MTCTKNKGRRTRDPNAPSSEFSDGAEYTATAIRLQQCARTKLVLSHLTGQANAKGLHLVTAIQMTDTLSVERKAER